MMSLLRCIRVGRHDMRKMYYWVGMFACVTGFLLLIVLLLRNLLGNQRMLPSFIGGYCAIFATILSLFQILEHLTCFSDPECQTKVVRILFMVPLYAMISWICILSPGVSEYLNLIRDTYESYVIYSFFQLMLALMGGADTVYRALMIEERSPIPHFFPFCWLEPLKVSPRFVQICRLCLFQFMVIKPLVTIVVVILTATNKMGTLLDVTKGYFWTTLVYNISITVAFTALVYFYTAMREFLDGKNALMKFLCIKVVIFLSFWQGLLIQLLASLDLLPQFEYWTPEEAPGGLQNLLICIEMLCVAFGHRYCFGSEEFASDLCDDAYSEADSSIGAGSSASVIVNRSTHRLIPPIRYSVAANLKYTLRHEDIFYDLRDIVHNR